MVTFVTRSRNAGKHTPSCVAFSGMAQSAKKGKASQGKGEVSVHIEPQMIADEVQEMGGKLDVEEEEVAAEIRVASRLIQLFLEFSTSWEELQVEHPSLSALARVSVTLWREGTAARRWLPQKRNGRAHL